MEDDLRREVLNLQEALLEERSAREELRDMMSAILETCSGSSSVQGEEMGSEGQGQATRDEEDDWFSSPPGLW